jgi:uncharacterized protein (TIGR00725 family)
MPALHRRFDMINRMQIAIGVMGSSASSDARTVENAVRLGALIAKKKSILVTGATTGLPLAAAKGAKQEGGFVIGFSPALNFAEHQKLGMPEEYHDLIVYTGLSFKGRNLLNVRASHALLFIGGSMGALNEFTIAYDEQKIIGVLEGSGGFCDHMRDWMSVLAKPHNRSILHFHSEPDILFESAYRSVLMRHSRA